MDRCSRVAHCALRGNGYLDALGGRGARALRLYSTYAAAQATPLPPQLALPAPPALGSPGGGAAPRAQSLASGGGGGVPFQGKRSSKSRRNSAKHVAPAPEAPSESLKRTWDFVERMDKDGVKDALLGGAEIIPLQDLKGKERATKRFEINDLYEDVCTRALSRMKQHGVLEDGAPSEERPDGPRCKCGARMVVSLSDAVQYWVDERLWRGGKRHGGKPGSRARRRRRSASVSTPC